MHRKERILTAKDFRRAYQWIEHLMEQQDNDYDIFVHKKAAEYWKNNIDEFGDNEIYTGKFKRYTKRFKEKYNLKYDLYVCYYLYSLEAGGYSWESTINDWFNEYAVGKTSNRKLKDEEELRNISKPDNVFIKNLDEFNKVFSPKFYAPDDLYNRYIKNVFESPINGSAFDASSEAYNDIRDRIIDISLPSSVLETGTKKLQNAESLLKLITKKPLNYMMSMEFRQRLYDDYIGAYNARKKMTPRGKKQSKRPTIELKDTLKYPFKSWSKIDKYEKAFGPIERIEYDVYKDKKASKLQKELSRPSYSPYPGGYEIDHLQDFGNITYLFIININTRYLYAIPVKGKGKDETLRAIKMVHEKDGIQSIKGDGDKGFNSLLLQKFYKDNNIKAYFTSSAFTYHNKIIDSVMRTLRNALGPNSNNMWDGTHDDIIQQLVNYYNNTYHRSIGMTPTEMHNDVSLEWAYIRRMDRKLEEIRKQQYEKGLYNYQEGNVIAVHLDYSKTSKKFEKRRRQFDKLAVFEKYKNGNVVCSLIPSGDLIEIPIYYSHYVAPSVEGLGQTEKSIFGLRD